MPLPARRKSVHSAVLNQDNVPCSRRANRGGCILLSSRECQAARISAVALNQNSLFDIGQRARTSRRTGEPMRKDIRAI
jgi:hypothetical protein